MQRVLTMQRVVFVLALVLSAGCAQTHGRVDSDAGSLPTVDGGPATTGDGGPAMIADAQRPPPRCEEALTLVDRVPQHFDAHHGPLSIASDGAMFWIAHMHGNPSPCDGSCLGLRPLSATGPIDPFTPLYWLYDGDRVELEVFGGVGRALAVRAGRPAAWQAWPVGPEAWRADATFAPRDAETVTSVVPRSDGGVDLLIRAIDETERGIALTRVVSLSAEGVVVAETEEVTVMEVRDARLVASRTGARWVASLQDWDFPPTVQIDRVDGLEGDSFHGSSCGVDDFDARELDQRTVVVAQRCGRVVQVEARDARGMPTAVTDDAAAVAPAVAVLERGREVVVAYALRGAEAPTVERLRLGDDGRFRSIGRITVAADSALRLPIAALDVETLLDGTVAVTWRGTVSDEDFIASDGAVVRLRRCD